MREQNEEDGLSGFNGLVVFLISAPRTANHCFYVNGYCLYCEKKFSTILAEWQNLWDNLVSELVKQQLEKEANND